MNQTLDKRDCFSDILGASHWLRAALCGMDEDGESIMEAQLSNEEAISLYLVDDSMLIGDTPGPVACKGVLQRLGLADAIER